MTPRRGKGADGQDQGKSLEKDLRLELSQGGVGENEALVGGLRGEGRR
jgi:hypothetical protein